MTGGEAIEFNSAFPEAFGVVPPEAIEGLAFSTKDNPFAGLKGMYSTVSNDDDVYNVLSDSRLLSFI